ncbi:tetratricopeptide repeat protein [Parabacteroides bouchesdurhonensis]|uniref:tetratricopeptide repeat protein n=1 Tax=Parabacteroides bouchesdurhonensis TaxID=1936995 RepID=UPI000E4F7540|nr:tetratricopeptide repeat protein [Parabacteroides bouchesdurhonensis]RHJ93623.1 tetratricopeptide repeat protein [Bacteroides sp. AM07-16]
MKPLSKKIFYTIAIALLCSGLQAQSLDQAKKLYNEGNYAEAKPAFEKLVKQAPSNSSYNHWYGVCCFETGDLDGAEKHLKVAVKRKVQEAYRYLAEVYYLTYRFEEASEMYEEYISLLSKKKQPVEIYEARQELADKALRMMEKVENVQVIDSMVVDKDAFLSAYILSEESGKLMPFEEFFETDIPVQSTVYMNQKGDKVYYAHPTDGDRYCLFNQSYIMDNWGDEKQLPMNVNSNDDDNYPFVLPDGVTIYYASKGNGSLGGYDLFVTRYNMNSDNYLAPEQLGMPYNSPFNDYMMVIDEVKGLGWFVSDRYQPEGKVCVYLFIPNDNRTRVDSDDIELKRSRAMLSSIKNSWKPDSNYANLIQLAHKEIPYGVEEIKKDFEFVINNNTVYYTLDEIKSPEAKNYYTKVIVLNKQIKELENKINNLRTSWNNGNNAKRDQLKPVILQAEEQLDELLSQPSELEKKARNAEMTFLKKNR